MFDQTLQSIRNEAAISKHLWVKVLGMLQQNWCTLEPTPGDGIDLIFFLDDGSVFDWIHMRDLHVAQKALQANGFRWMWTRSSFYSAAGVPELPANGIRRRSRPIYSGGEYWIEPCISHLPPHRAQGVPMQRAPDDLSRFVDAQDLVWYSVVEELAAGCKETHWMWFIFPQLRGLGSSRMAEYFGLTSPSEAAQYWDHPILGSRVRSCLEILLSIPDSLGAEDVFGKVDAIKLRSCMTIFENVSYKEASVIEVLNRFFAGERCPRTLELIRKSGPARRMYISR